MARGHFNPALMDRDKIGNEDVSKLGTLSISWMGFPIEMITKDLRGGLQVLQVV